MEEVTRVKTRMVPVLGPLAAVVVLLFGCSQAATVAQQSPTSDPSIRAYQTLMLSDDTAMGASTSNHCNTVQDTACPAAVARVVTTLQAWLDDLNRFQTPARFATIDAQMKRHLTAVISYLNLAAAANVARNQSLEDRSIAAAINEKGWVDEVASSVAQSKPAAVAIYTGVVGSVKSELDSCASCQRLAGQSQLNCVGAAVTDCDSLVIDAAIQVRTFQSALVQDAVPSVLSAKDGQLQSDLAMSDTALIAMMGALLTSDQSGFSGGRSSFQRSMAAVDADATAASSA
jgi:hypothetical protein